MPLVDIVLNRRKYSISCEPGQERRLRELADYFTARTQELVQGGAKGSDAHLLVLTGLLVTDKLFDLTEELEQTRARLAFKLDQSRSVAAVDAVTRRIEELANRLERMYSKH